MNSLDITVLGILSGSMVLGLMRGLVRETFSLAAWGMAFLGARQFAPAVAAWLPGADAPGLRHAAALVLTFIVLLLATGFVGGLLSGAMKKAGLGVQDRLLGGIFGIARGGIALAGLTIVAGLTALPKTDFWLQAISRPYLELAAARLLPWLPADLAALLQYS
ncbi:MAG: CvpA family protein [Betaproteobacteria bacterium]|nr:CvpA family protein [Betaproteobacteria bacterium]